MRETLEDYCKRMQMTELLAQWDQTRNFPITPQSVTYGSQRRVWWQCDKGHRWQAAVYTRISGSGCPVCAGKRPDARKNDLAARYPELARQWHPVRNGALTPRDVLPGSHRMVWWRCKNGHEWIAQIKSRTAGSGCPVCASRKVLAGDNDLQSQFPAIAAQWHPEKNGTLSPRDVVPGSHCKVWWLCEKGHAWQAQVASRTANGSGCPVCAGKKVVSGDNDLQSRFPEVAAQWHPTHNGALTPRDVTAYANRKVWWMCERGHAYRATVAARTMRGCGCPYCAGRKALPGFNDLATIDPETAKQWHPTLNGTLTPSMVTAGSRRRVWWQCSEGHVWQAIIYSRTGSKKCGCPICAGHTKRTKAQHYQTMLAQVKGAER